MVAKYLNCAHTNTHIRAHARTYTHALTTTLSILLGMRTSALNFLFGTGLLFLPPHVGQPLPLFLSPLFTHFTPSQVYSLFGTPKKTKKNLEDHQLFFLSGNKSKLNEKTFFLFLFFSNSRHNVYQYSNLSVSTPRYSVRTSRHISHWTTCSYATPYTVKRSVCFG